MPGIDFNTHALVMRCLTPAATPAQPHGLVILIAIEVQILPFDTPGFFSISQTVFFYVFLAYLFLDVYTYMYIEVLFECF